MDHMRMQQHTRRPPVQQERDADEDILNEGEYDDAWPARMPSSTRRYQSLPDVRSETGRRQVDAQPATGQRFYTPGSPYERHTAIPPRRTATQSSLPAVPSKRHSDGYTDDTIYRGKIAGFRGRRGKSSHWLLFSFLVMFCFVVVFLSVFSICIT